MEFIGHILHNVFGCTLLMIFFAWNCKAYFTIGYNTSARQLDSLLQGYAFRAFNHPHTGTPYTGVVPPNLTGINIAALRLRCGSLRTRGFNGYMEFDIPTGVIVQPYVKRLAFVYQNLGNWSSSYYTLQGYTYLAPVLGLLAYSAANVSAINLSEVDFRASRSPISIKFTDVRSAPSGSKAKCVYFDVNGTFQLTDLMPGNICSTFRQGHFSIVVKSSGIVPSPAGALVPFSSPGEGHKFKMWKIYSMIGGIVGLLLLILLISWLILYRKRKKLFEMQIREEVGEILRMGLVRDARVPIAPMTRTPPAIENDYVP